MKLSRKTYTFGFILGLFAAFSIYSYVRYQQQDELYSILNQLRDRPAWVDALGSPLAIDNGLRVWMEGKFDYTSQQKSDLKDKALDELALFYKNIQTDHSRDFVATKKRYPDPGPYELMKDGGRGPKPYFLSLTLVDNFLFSLDGAGIKGMTYLAKKNHSESKSKDMLKEFYRYAKISINKGFYEYTPFRIISPGVRENAYYKTHIDFAIQALADPNATYAPLPDGVDPKYSIKSILEEAKYNTPEQNEAVRLLREYYKEMEK